MTNGRSRGVAPPPVPESLRPRASAPPPDGRREVHLHPGQIHVAAEGTAISTVLGSCVAVCLWDPDRRVGGANHFLLPDPGPDPGSPRFGTYALPALLMQLAGLGSQRRNLKAKLFGGACVLQAFRARNSDLGEMNVELARRFLAEAGIPIVAEDTLGNAGRKVVFHTDDGSAWVRKL